MTAAPTTAETMEMNWNKALEILQEKLNGWLETFVSNVPNLAIALAIVVFFGVVSGPAAKLFGRFSKRVGATSAIAALTSSMARVAVVLLGAVVALGVMGLDKTIFSMLAGAGIVGIAVGFAFQDLAANLIAGVAMGIRKPFHVDDQVETNGYFGVVHRLNLRNTLVRTFDGRTVVIPNKEVFENPLINYSMSAKRRVDVEVGVAYETELRRAVEVAGDAVRALDFALQDEPVEVFAEEFGGSSIDLVVRFWIDVPGDVIHPEAKHHAIVAIHEAFREHEIEIPFPIRTLDLGRARSVVMEAAGSREDRNGAAAREAEPADA